MDKDKDTMKVELSERMQAVASLVSKTGTAADVGCDHGYVAIWLIQNEICKKVIAMDVNKGPLERATEHIRDYGLEQYIETRLSNGTAALQPGEIDSLVCAGMGGKLMMQILEAGADKVKTMKELILQPQSELREMRCYLREHGMYIIEEDMVLDAEKFYPMMKVSVSDVVEISNDSHEKDDWKQRMEDTYGPCLLQHKHPVLMQFLQKRIEICRMILDQLVSGGEPNDRQKQRINEIKEEIQDIEKVLTYYYEIR